MAVRGNMEVTLVFPDAETIQKHYKGLIYLAARTCYSEQIPQQIWDAYSSDSIAPDKVQKLIEHVIDSGHHSTIEHINFTFAITGVSRTLSHQLVRHRIGVAFDQQSQRYTVFGGRPKSDVHPEWGNPEPSQRSTKLTKGDELRLAYEYQEGETARSLAKKFGIPDHLVIEIAKTHSPVSSRSFVEERDDVSPHDKARILGSSSNSHEHTKSLVEEFYPDFALGLFETFGELSRFGDFKWNAPDLLASWLRDALKKHCMAYRVEGYPEIEEVNKITSWLYQNANPLSVDREKFLIACQLNPDLDTKREEMMELISKEKANSILPETLAKNPKAAYTAVDQYVYQMELYREMVESGIPAEDARFIFPNGARTNLIMTVNLRELLHMAGLRLCTLAQWEIRQMFKCIRKELMAADSYFGKMLVPKCVPLGSCDEKRNEDGHCRIRPHKKHVLNVYNDYKAGKLAYREDTAKLV